MDCELLPLVVMRSTELRSVFRRVLALGLIPPAALAACGGGLAVDVADPDAGGTSQQPTPTKDGGIAVPDSSSHRDASNPPDAKVTKDAQSVDAEVVDAGLDGCVSTPAPPPVDPDASFTCMWTVPLPCSVSSQQSPSQAECKIYCGQDAIFCNAQQSGAPGGGGDADAPEWVLQCVSCAIGRRPEGFVSQLGARRSARADKPVGIVGQFFATAAELEAASVSSFERLERELESHGAPADLRRRARSAAEDERRHARVTHALAGHFGAGTGAANEDACATTAPRHVRSLDSVALENAVEGCVRETFGALTATLQAERATDPRVRAAMRRIATDETAHAALAWSIASWLSTQLDADTQKAIQSAMSEAIDGLAREMAADPPADLQAVCGLPSSREAASMLAGMRELLWAA